MQGLYMPVIVIEGKLQLGLLTRLTLTKGKRQLCLHIEPSLTKTKLQSELLIEHNPKKEDCSQSCLPLLVTQSNRVFDRFAFPAHASISSGPHPSDYAHALTAYHFLPAIRSAS